MTRSRTPKRSEAARSRRIAARAIAIPAAVVVVAGMTVAGTIALPDSRAGSSAPAQPVRVPAADYDTACPGPVGQAKSADSSLVFSNDASGVKQWFDAVSAPSDVLADKRPGPSSAFDVTALGSDKAGDTMLSGDAGSESSSGTVKTGEPLDSAFGLTGTVSGDKPAQVQAAQVSLASKGDLRGLSAATCGTLGSDFWIVGGSTEVGRSARLVLTNPTRTSATVNVSVYGAKGRVKTSGGGSLLVDAGSQRSVLIEGLAPDDGQVAVHVTGTGGLFSAAIEHNILRGLHPGGVDYLVPGATPSRTQYVPGISIATKAPDTKQFSDGRPVLRLANTGTDAAHASIRLFGPEGVASFSASKAVVKPGAVRDIPLDQLPKGTYSAVVTSDAPVSAAARSIRQGGPKDADFSWSPSVSPLQDEQMATIPAESTPRWC